MNEFSATTCSIQNGISIAFLFKINLFFFCCLLHDNNPFVLMKFKRFGGLPVGLDVLFAFFSFFVSLFFVDFDYDVLKLARNNSLFSESPRDFMNFRAISRLNCLKSM